MHLTRSIHLSLIHISLLGLCTLISACGGSSGTTSIDEPIPIVTQPVNQISHAYFLDQNEETNKLSGSITIQTNVFTENNQDTTESLWVYWADNEGNKYGDVWLKTNSSSIYNVEIPDNTIIPENISALLLYPTNTAGQAQDGTLLKFIDFTGNALLSGLGGNEKSSWEYGVNRTKISIKRLENGLCIFDNGLVSVINMNNTKDTNALNSIGPIQPKEVDDQAFPPYSFLCDEQPVHNSDHITDEVGVWTYSTMNDAMFYGTSVYNTFVKYLAEPPLNEKIRIRVHYGYLHDVNAFWDGAYFNFTDAYPLFYSTASLDIIAHEIAHGVLSKISPLNIFKESISTDARTLHEAFGDISGVIAKYEFTGHDNNWIHGEESYGPTRQLNQIETEPGAISSFLDYEEAEDNFYLRIGMITYPFYFLSNEWGLETTYNLYLSAAKNCWPTTVTLTEAAQCIKQQAGLLGLSEDAVINAFKQVKIKLFEEGVLSHFTVEQFKFRVKFNDNSQSTNQVTQWHWDFGDGQTSNEQNPEHTYAQAGAYLAKLIVTDQSNNQIHYQDSFQRLLSVSDQYCAISQLNVDNKITSVMINNVDINFNPLEWDYTETPLELNSTHNLVIDIEGDTQSTLKSTTWKVWIDLNDNGIFGDNNEELVVNEVVEKEQPYRLNTTVDLSLLPNDNRPKYLRISGDNSVITSPCSSNVSNALDLKISW